MEKIRGKSKILKAVKKLKKTKKKSKRKFKTITEKLKGN